MCLIIAGKSNQIRTTLLSTPNLAEDIYMSNSDGIGAMYINSKGLLRTPKLLPQTLRQFVGFIKQLPDDDRSIAIHARYKTHGEVNLENCHPYTVVKGQVAMMHNGVLSQGNKADPTKSDTWHYINDVLREQLTYAPSLFTFPSWLKFVEEDIGGGNRFVFMDCEGNMAIANRDTGIEHDGMWFSNTYAWSPELLIPGYARPKKFNITSWKDRDYSYAGYYGGAYDGFVGDPADDDEALGAQEAAHEAAEDWADEVWLAIAESDAEYLKDLLVERPYLTLRTLYKHNEFVCSVDPTELSAADYEYVKLLQDEEVVRMAGMVVTNDTKATKIAEVACWYGEWMGKGIESNDDPKADEQAALAAVTQAATTTTAAETTV